MSALNSNLFEDCGEEAFAGVKATGESVIAQSPAAGQKVVAGTAVNFEVR